MSNARSPREVCSITIGINGLMQAPCFRGSTASSLERPLLFRASTASRAPGRARAESARPRARVGELWRNPLDLGDDEIQRLAHPQVFAEELVASAREQLLDDLVRLVALRLRRLATHGAQPLTRRGAGA